MCYKCAIFVLSPINNSVMRIITAREFRANQKKYLDLAATEKVVILRNNSPSIQLVPMLDDGTTMNADLLAKIKKLRQEKVRRYDLLMN